MSFVKLLTKLILRTDIHFLKLTQDDNVNKLLSHLFLV